MNNTQSLQAKKPQTIQQFLTAYRGQITAALPKHMDTDRICRIALTEIRRTPSLMKCDTISLFGAIIQASQLGLEIGPGGAHLVPFKNQVNMIPDYRGLMSLARNSGEIKGFHAQIVKDNDFFEYQYGTDEHLRFRPAANNRGETIGAFAYAGFKGGGGQFEYMTVDEIGSIRDRSPAKAKGPWVTDYEAMAKKTVIRRICKFLPSSANLQRAIHLDEMNDREVSQDNSAILDGDFMEIPEPAAGKPEVATPKAVAP